MTTTSGALETRKRWIALAVVCTGTLMIVLDTTIVNVALPSIRDDLGFSETSLVWVVNAYLLTFGGCLLLGGRLGDLYGHRRLFVAGLLLFTIASLACGLSSSPTWLVGARAVLGIGGAIVDSIALSLVMALFPEHDERAKAMGVYGFVCAAGGSVGVLAGGLLTQALSWHWVFLVNVPLGLLVAALCFPFVPAAASTSDEPAGIGRLDLGGALTVTAALMLATYAIVDGNEARWTSTQTLALLGASLVLLATFVAIEARASTPLMPLRLFRTRQVVAANLVGALWAAGMFAWFFVSALYLQAILGYDAKSVGLAYLPSNLLMAMLSVGVSARLVTRFGFRGPTTFGMGCAALGLLSFAFAPVDGNYWVDVLPGMTLMGIGGGVALTPLLMAAMSDVDASESGIASGIVNTAFMMGGALGLAVLASIAASHTAALSTNANDVVALDAGYRRAFGVGAASALLAAVLAWTLIRKGPANATADDASTEAARREVRA